MCQVRGIKNNTLIEIKLGTAPLLRELNKNTIF